MGVITHVCQHFYFLIMFSCVEIDILLCIDVYVNFIIWFSLFCFFYLLFPLNYLLTAYVTLKTISKKKSI